MFAILGLNLLGLGCVQEGLAADLFRLVDGGHDVHDVLVKNVSGAFLLEGVAGHDSVLSFIRVLVHQAKLQIIAFVVGHVIVIVIQIFVRVYVQELNSLSEDDWRTLVLLVLFVVLLSFVLHRLDELGDFLLSI